MQTQVKMRYGILGCGSVSSFHAEAILRTGGIIFGACSHSERSTSQFADRWSAIAFHSYEEMLHCPDIDVIVLCTPSGMHASQAVQALRAGKHVIVEKPMSTTLVGADEVIQAARETGKIVVPISQMRFYPNIQAAKRAVESGAIGKVISASLSMQYYRKGEYYSQAAWRGTWEQEGGGCLITQGIHGVDTFRYIVGPVAELDAYIATRVHDIEVEDCTCAMLRLKNGGLATIDASTASCPGYSRRLQVCGSLGSFVLEDSNIVSWDVPDTAPLPVDAAVSGGAVAKARTIQADVHVPQYENFLRYLAGTEPLLLGAPEGKEPLEIILNIYASAKAGKRIALS